MIKMLFLVTTAIEFSLMSLSNKLVIFMQRMHITVQNMICESMNSLATI